MSQKYPTATATITTTTTATTSKLTVEGHPLPHTSNKLTVEGGGGTIQVTSQQWKGWRGAQVFQEKEQDATY